MNSPSELRLYWSSQPIVLLTVQGNRPLSADELRLWVDVVAKIEEFREIVQEDV